MNDFARLSSALDNIKIRFEAYVVAHPPSPPPVDDQQQIDDLASKAETIAAEIPV